MESDLKRKYLEFCRQLIEGERGTRVELQKSFAATMALAENNEDSLFIISQRDDLRHITGHTVTEERRFASTRELTETGILPNVTAFLICSSWLPH